MSPHQPQPRPRSAGRHTLNPSAPAPLTQTQQPPSTPPPSYKDIAAEDRRSRSRPSSPSPRHAHPLRNSNAAAAAAAAFLDDPPPSPNAALHAPLRRRSLGAISSPLDTDLDLAHGASSPPPRRLRRRSSATGTRMRDRDLQPLTAARVADRDPEPSESEPQAGTGTSKPAVHPQVAGLLGVKRRWHVPLLCSRALACAPAIYWFMGHSSAFLDLLLGEIRGQRMYEGADEGTLVLTEVGLALLWCATSGYLSFYFLDCLMSRWLLNYAAPATLVRLWTVVAINFFTTSRWLRLSGAGDEPRLLLPAWIAIATTLTLLYLFTHRHVNIRRETRAALRAFWFSTSVSLFALLLHRHVARESWRQMPLFRIASDVVVAWRGAAAAASAASSS
ncbi:N-glycosylation protein-domain-containing protein [Phyllosticta citrichinensis]|uniref:N-glycosylation protein-domain-containing protein n=1 Tax=Phyllosticta citrichinensis TaxID=1130410 RepID=A0ABR1XFC9_9PEZI